MVVNDPSSQDYDDFYIVGHIWETTDYRHIEGQRLICYYTTLLLVASGGGGHRGTPVKGWHPTVNWHLKNT